MLMNRYITYKIRKVKMQLIFEAKRVIIIFNQYIIRTLKKSTTSFLCKIKYLQSIILTEQKKKLFKMVAEMGTSQFYTLLLNTPKNITIGKFHLPR